jgi:hypothetical protein
LAVHALNGGRAWWAHFEFTRINIEPIILRKKVEEQPALEARVLRFQSGAVSGSLNRSASH